MDCLLHQIALTFSYCFVLVFGRNGLFPHSLYELFHRAVPWPTFLMFSNFSVENLGMLDNSANQAES